MSIICEVLTQPTTTTAFLTSLENSWEALARAAEEAAILVSSQLSNHKSMESTQNSVSVRQTSVNIEHLQSKPASSGVGRTRSHRMSSTSHPSDHSPNDKTSIDGWIQGHPVAFQDVNVGVIRDMMRLARVLFKEVVSAAGNYIQENSIPGLLQQGEKFSLWKDGNSDFDEKLQGDPTVRKPIVSNLLHIVRVLSTGSIHWSTPRMILP